MVEKRSVKITTKLMYPMRLVPKSKKPVPRAAWETLFNWLWILMFLGAVFYLQTLLGEMRGQTQRLANERHDLENKLNEADGRNNEFFKNFRTSADNVLERLRDAEAERRYETFFAPKPSLTP